MQDNRGSRPNIQWLIRTESEKQIGPYSTEAILKLISEGALTGGEKIKRYPDGKWTAISRQTDFYDKLLEALEEVPKAEALDHEKNREKFEAETVLVSLPEKKQSEDFEKTVIVPRSPLKPTAPAHQQHEVPNPNSLAPEPIEMVALDKVEKIEKFRSAKLPIFLSVAAIILGMIGYLWPEGNQTGGKPHLLVPRAGVAGAMAPGDVKAGIQKAVSEFTKSTFEGNLEAENKLVAVIEGAPQNVEARGILCLVYKELWPYVKQDSHDLDAVYGMAKSTRSQDPTGVNGVYCEIVKLMTLGKYKEARGVVEYALNQPQMSTAPVLYQLKAELLFEERDIKTATLYTDKAKQLWPEWVKPNYDLARYLAKSEQNAGAAQAFQETLKKNPKHKLAQIDYGILLFKSFRQTDEAMRFLSSALATSGRMTSIDSARAHFFLGLMLVEKKDLARAKEQALAAYKLNPSDPQIKELVTKLGGATDLGRGNAENNELIFLGDQHQRTGNCLAAQAEYKAAFELDPTNAVAAMKAAKCLWQLNQSAEATHWLKKAIKADSKLSSAYVLLADYQSDRYDYIGAMQTLNKASQLFPNNYEVLRGYGLVEYRRNNMKEAIGYLQRSYKIYENDIETLILLAKAYSAAGDFSSAQKYSVRAIELDATSTDAQIVYARILTQFQGLETGLLYLRDLIVKFSYTIDFRLALADLYREQERSDQAQKVYEQIVDADPKNKKARLGLGESYQALGFFDKALKQYLAASVIDPSDAEGLFKAGLLYMDMAKYPEAITQLKRAQQINPLFPRLNYFMGRAFFQSGLYEQALAAAGEERKINPNIADSYTLAAEIYASTKQFQKCAAEYQQAIKLRPQGAELYVKVARCYRQSGSPDIAKSMLNIASSQESGLPEIYKELGAVYETEGDIRAAVESYNKYLALSPNAPDRKEIEARIVSISR
jgi:tetratricopeptide (TPR) repeat protein